MAQQEKADGCKDMEELKKAIDRKDVREFNKLFDGNIDQKNFKSDVRNYRCQPDDNEKTTETNYTMLHHAAVNLDEKHNSIIEKLVRLSPDLLACEQVSTNRQGQTPLHILIARKQKDTLRKIKDLMESGELEMGDTVRNNVANPKVRGKWFKKTIMEGELPHIVAALTLDKDITNVVIEITKSNIEAQNSKGNTVYHCLVKYAARNPDEMQKIIEMWEYLASYGGDDEVQKAIGSEALQQTNNGHLRPLQLAAKLGVADLFKIILKSERIQNVEGGLFDAYLYDVSVIDTVAHFKVQKGEKKEHDTKEPDEKAKTKQNQVGQSDSRPEAGNKVEQIGKAVIREKFKWSQSVLEMVCNSKVARNKDSVYQIIRQPAVKMVIDMKWAKCKWLVGVLAILHLIIMMWYSAYAILWSVVAFPSNETHPATTESERTFVLVSSLLFFVVDLLYLIITVLLVISRFKRPKRREYIWHDLEYIVLLGLFSIGLLIDNIWHQIYLEHNASVLIISLLSGWWFSVFFSRAWELLSCYVAMIKKVIFNDLCRFGLFILLSVVSFSIALQIVYHGSGVPTLYNETTETTNLLQVFTQTMMINIQLMFGLGDIEVLNEAREPAMAYILYLVYVIMTYLVLLNSLIAMISETCATIRENETVFYHTQRLSVILFLEEISYPFWYLNDYSLPEVQFELRSVKRQNKPAYDRYFINMTDERIKKEASQNESSSIDQQLKPTTTQAPTLILRQPFFEEFVVNDQQTDYKLTWK